jgi:hypothetical protein
MALCVMSRSQRIPITNDIYEHLNNERKRTGVSNVSLLNNAESIPKGLTYGIVGFWLSGKAKTAERRHIDWAIKEYRKLPDEEKYCELTDAVRNDLKSEIKRTGLSPKKLIGQIEGEIPKKFKARTFENWLYGYVKRVPETQIKWLIDAYAKINSRRLITEEMRQRLKAEMTRTGISAKVLFTKHINDNPHKFGIATFVRWLDPSEYYVQGHHYEWMLNLLISLPDSERMPIGSTEIKILTDHIERTGCGPRKILRGTSDQIPEGLTSDYISRWKIGKLKSAKIEHWQWVISLYETYTPDENRISRDSIIQSLKFEIKRTGVPPLRFFKMHKGSLPSGIVRHTIPNWLQPKVKMIDKSHFEWVIREYKKLDGELFVSDLTNSKIETLEKLVNEAQLSPLQILRLAPRPLPRGLTTKTISRWLTRKAKTVRQEHWDFIIKTLEDVLVYRNK